MQFSTVVIALTAASAVSAANATANGTAGHHNGSNSSANGSKNGSSAPGDSGAAQTFGAGVFGVAAAAGVAMLL